MKTNSRVLITGASSGIGLHPAHQFAKQGHRLMANKALVQGRRFLTEKAQAEPNAKVYGEVEPEDRKRERGDFENQEN